MSYIQDNDIEALLDRVKTGDEEAKERLFALVYKDLKELAKKKLRKEKSGYHLNEDDLVNETVMRFNNHDLSQINTRAHFLNWMAYEMRRVLVDEARRRYSAKRGGSFEHVDIDDVATTFAAEPSFDMLEINTALARLAQLDSMKALVVELMFFGGFSNEEVAEALQISTSTVKRHWQSAKRWLYHELAK